MISGDTLISVEKEFKYFALFYSQTFIAKQQGYKPLLKMIKICEDHHYQDLEYAIRVIMSLKACETYGYYKTIEESEVRAQSIIR